MTMLSHFLDETIEKFMDCSPKSVGGHMLLVLTQIHVAHFVKPTFKSCPKKIPYKPRQHCLYLSCGIPCRISLNWKYFRPWTTAK